MINDNLTIAIPVFERDDFFEMAITSAINQTVQCKIIVVDNNSSHNRFKEYVESLNLHNLTYFKNEENLGMIGNWNRCIELCSTEYLSILHDDDILHLQFVEAIGRIDKNWDILFSQSEVRKNPSSKFTDKINLDKFKVKGVTSDAFVFGNFNYAPGTVFKVSSAKLLGGFSNEYGYILDFHMWIKFTARFKAIYTTSILSFYRESEIQGTRTLYKDMILNTYRIMKLVPRYNNSKIMRFLSDYLIFSGGLDIHLLTEENKTKDINIEFKDCPQFLNDYRRFGWFYRFKILSLPLRKGLKEIFKMYLNS
ncbi:glycosyltransferase family 2 protein [Pedobacter frigidisoli]|uniref:glycosyltransferase family 2 protein n=1 Tax=Pedobacter frigidisoli TaxID=2530455 RepID=UPI00292F629C|nr:glycosyltransferase [Pedobacter frigidisoli]